MTQSRRIIDFHTHLDDRWFDTALMTPAAFIDALDRCHIEKACIFTLMGFYEDARPHNDKLLAHAAAHPDRLFPFITVDPKLGKPAIAELERCIATGKFRGVKFHPWIQAFAPSMVKPTMIEIVQRAAAAGLPVIFHDGTPPYATSFQIAAVARWVPEATIILGHAGLADYNLPAADLVRDIPNLYACVCCPPPADIRHLVQTAGPAKILFGSDLGLSDWTILPDRLDSLLHAGLSDSDLEAILYHNAARMLHL